MADDPRRALVVGNSDGIGLALTRRLLAGGWAVAGVSRRGSEVRDERYTHAIADVTGPGFPAALAEAARPGVDLCVYAAGIGEFLDLEDLAAQTRTLEVNLMGLARTVEAVVPGMAAARRGHLVGLSSLADAAASPQAPAYAASKAGMTTYLRGLALALRPHGVHVTTVRFGFVDTKMAKAPVKPGLVTVERAVDVLMRALRTRPATVSYPRRISAAARLLSAVPAAQLRFGRAPR
ncbi:SDR family NAD(P)-dependent oxidoreductase [Dactylosporangium salmoneum]|uniref:Short-chain dehydrogenase n=1 Tax=Dactylosporangium salmoneum TaxID=53361 RepID=A0ABN3HAH5_9ACTN